MTDAFVCKRQTHTAYFGIHPCRGLVLRHILWNQFRLNGSGPKTNRRHTSLFQLYCCICSHSVTLQTRKKRYIFKHQYCVMIPQTYHNMMLYARTHRGLADPVGYVKEIAQTTHGWYEHDQTIALSHHHPGGIHRAEIVTPVKAQRPLIWLQKNGREWKCIYEKISGDHLFRMSNEVYLRPVLLMVSQIPGSTSQNLFPMFSKITYT